MRRGSRPPSRRSMPRQGRRPGSPRRGRAPAVRFRSSSRTSPRDLPRLVRTAPHVNAAMRRHRREEPKYRPAVLQITRGFTGSATSRRQPPRPNDMLPAIGSKTKGRTTMDILHGRAPKVSTAAAVGLAAALALAACVPPSEEPDRIQTSNPSVTYEYQTDEQLIEARQEAAEYCSRFQAVPHAVDYDDTTTKTDLGRSVVFECVSAPPAPGVTASASPELTYIYRTDSALQIGRAHV